MGFEEEGIMAYNSCPCKPNLRSQIKYEPQEGYFLVTASYDMTAKVWPSRDFKPIKLLSGHEAKVTCVDVVADEQSIATVSHNRTIKLWSSKISEKEKAMDLDKISSELCVDT